MLFHFGYDIGSKQISKCPNKIGAAPIKCPEKICDKLNPFYLDIQ